MNYEVRGVPAFFILDENRTIRQVLYGYSPEHTDELVINTINDLI